MDSDHMIETIHQESKSGSAKENKNYFSHVTRIHGETVQKPFRQRPLPCSEKKEKEGSSPQKGLALIQGFHVHIIRWLRKRMKDECLQKPSKR